MYNFKYNWMFLFFLFISPFMVWSMNLMFSVWVNMELNLMIFIGFLMLNNLNIYNMSMKYYLINSFSSSMFMMMINLNMFGFNYLINLIMNFMMIMKLGMFPFFFWFLDLMMNLNWISCLILSTWQKFIPYIIMIYIYDVNLYMLIIFFSSLISIYYGINQIMLKKILCYSSILHMSWMMFLICMSEILWLIYYFSYMIINFSLMNMLNIFNMNYLLDLNKFFNLNLMLIFMFLMFSLSSLPPFFGFLMKWYSILYFMDNLNYFLILYLIFCSLMFMYNYIKIIFLFMIMNFSMFKFNFMFLFNFKLKINFMLKFIFLYSLMNLFLISFMFFY